MYLIDIWNKACVKMRWCEDRQREQQSVCQWSLPFAFSVFLVSSSRSTLLWNLRRPCAQRETPWTPIAPQLSLSILSPFSQFLGYLTPPPPSLNMTLSIHLSFPSQINNLIGSSPHGLCLLFLSSSSPWSSFLLSLILSGLFSLLFPSAFVFRTIFFICFVSSVVEVDHMYSKSFHFIWVSNVSS